MASKNQLPPFFSETVARVTKALIDEGFGILTDYRPVNSVVVSS